MKLTNLEVIKQTEKMFNTTFEFGSIKYQQSSF